VAGLDPQCEEIQLQSDGLALAACVYRPAAPGPAPALIVCHGFASCKENHAVFARQAAQAGFVALAFDFRGHGSSEGCLDSRSLNDIGAALAYLAQDPQVDSRRIIVRGSSMGGFFALHAAARWPDVAAVVAICPTTEALLATLLRDIGNPDTEWGRARRTDPTFPRVMGCDLSCWLEKVDVYAAPAHISPRPLLLIHCTADELVPVQVSHDLYAAAREPRALWLLEGGDHRFAQHDPATTARTLSWLKEQVVSDQ
jgi:dipeptidyl aminopeptidase/acylaminoacyl peptidase